jgi:hypothetical protein
MKIKSVLKSKYCWFVIVVSLVLSYFLIVKKFTAFSNLGSIFLSVVYIFSFAISNSCLIRDIKESVKSKIKSGTNSVVSIIGSILGFGAVQLCTVSGTCGVSIFTSLLLSIFPNSIAFFFIESGIWILLIADILLLFSIYRMRCFRKEGK